MRNAMIINAKDNVVVAVEPVAQGAKITYELDGKSYEITACDAIPMYHKAARVDIKKGERIIKYGEYIGEAGTDIHAGAHVHTHNVLSIRERVVD